MNCEIAKPRQQATVPARRLKVCPIHALRYGGIDSFFSSMRISVIVSLSPTSSNSRWARLFRVETDSIRLLDPKPRAALIAASRSCLPMDLPRTAGSTYKSWSHAPELRSSSRLAAPHPDKCVAHSCTILLCHKEHGILPTKLFGKENSESSFGQLSHRELFHVK